MLTHHFRKIKSLVLHFSNRRQSHIFVLVILFASVHMQWESQIHSLQESTWSVPQTIPGYELETWPPILVADHNGTVHAFSSQWVSGTGTGSNLAIVYNHWTRENGWSAPVDILLSPVKEARLTDVYLDSKGMFHVLFFGGDNTYADIYYSQAFADLVGKAGAWSEPAIIGENAGDPKNSVFFEDGQGTLSVIYNGGQQGSGLYLVNSKDNGNTWSNSNPIFFTQSDEPNIDQLDVIKSRSGWFHAIWGVYNVSGQGRGIYYSRSRDGNVWSEPVLLADAKDGYGTQGPTIIEYKDSLFVFYHPPGKITMRRSFDDGLTWSDGVILFPRHIGVNGSISAVVDGSDTLHLFFGQRISGSPDIHGMWHSTWINNRWLEPEGIVKGPSVNDPVGEKSFDPFEAKAVVSLGNTILTTWRTDPGLKGNGVWYSYKVLDIPGLTISIPTVETSPMPDSTPIPTHSFNNPSTNTAEVLPENQSLPVELSTAPTVWSFGTLMAVVAIPILVILLAVVIMKALQKREG